MSGTPQPDFTVGIDVGGTWLRTAVVAESGEIVARDRVALAEIERTSEAFFDRLVNGVQELGSRAALLSGSPQPKAIGIAVPGLLDANQEAVLRSVSLPFLERIPLRRMLEERLGRRVALTTDAQACCLAEYQAHRPRVSRFVHLRFGTGIGCAVVRGNYAELLERDGLRHPALLVVEHRAEAIPCRCGLTGCLETVASGAALKSGSVERAVRGTIRALLKLASHYQPEVISLGGGGLVHHPEFEHLLGKAYAVARDGMGGLPSMSHGRLGDDAGILGAALAARSRPLA